MARYRSFPKPVHPPALVPAKLGVALALAGVVGFVGWLWLGFPGA